MNKTVSTASGVVVSQVIYIYYSDPGNRCMVTAFFPILLPHKEKPCTNRRERASNDVCGQGLPDILHHGFVLGFGQVIQPVIRYTYNRLLYV